MAILLLLEALGMYACGIIHVTSLGIGFVDMSMTVNMTLEFWQESYYDRKGSESEFTTEISQKIC